MTTKEMIENMKMKAAADMMIPELRKFLEKMAEAANKVGLDERSFNVISFAKLLEGSIIAADLSGCHTKVDALFNQMKEHIKTGIEEGKEEE